MSYDKETGKWFAAISKEGVVYRKRFLTFEEACEYREMLEIEHYGFAKSKFCATIEESLRGGSSIFVYKEIKCYTKVSH